MLQMLIHIDTTGLYRVTGSFSKNDKGEVSILDTFLKAHVCVTRCASNHCWLEETLISLVT
jgi:hypothetical protein